MKKLNQVQPGYDERPSNAHHRTEKYLGQVKVIIDKLNHNKVTTCPMPQIEPSFIRDLHDRASLTDNRKEDHGNACQLNIKVQSTLSKFKQQHGMNLDPFITRLKQIDDEVLPLHSVRVEVVGYYWKKFSSNCAMLNYKSYRDLNRKRIAPRTCGGPPTTVRVIFPRFFFSPVKIFAVVFFACRLFSDNVDKMLYQNI